LADIEAARLERRRTAHRTRKPTRSARA